MSKKRSREDGAVNLELVEIYEDLANENERVRLNAAQAAVSQIRKGAVLIEDVLTRLVRGLASGRKSARIGFAVAFTEILRQHDGFPTKDMKTGVIISTSIDLLEKATRIGGDAKGQEVRDHYYGRLFGLAGIVQSGILFSQIEALAQWDRVVDLLFDTSKKKIWLREECGWVLYCAVKSLKAIPAGHVYAQHLMDRLHAHTQEMTPEGVVLWITVRQHFPETMMPSQIFSNNDPLSRNEKGTLARILKQAPEKSKEEDADNPTLSNQATGIWLSKLHFAWNVVLEAVSETREKRITFPELWREAVDESLFSTKSSPERKYWGFLLFQRYIMTSPKEIIPCLFGPNIMRCLKSELASEENYLHTLAGDVIDSIVARSLEDQNCIPELIAGFLAADVNFDRLLRSKPMEKIIGRANSAGLEQIVQGITHRINEMTQKDTAENKHGLTSLVDLLVSVIRLREFPVLDPELKQYRRVLDEILRFIVVHAFSPTPVSGTRDIFKQRLMSSLNHLTAKDAQPAYHPCRVVMMIRNTNKSDLNAEASVLEAIEQGSDLLQKVQEKDLARKDGPQKNTLQAFELLLAFALIQAYSGEAESVNTIDDLQNCYKSLVRHRSNDNEEEDVVALIEIIVEFVSKPSALYRRLAPRILKAFASQVTAEALDSMLRVLTTSESTVGQAELFAAGNEEDGMDVDSEDDATAANSVIGLMNGELEASASESGGDSEDSGTSELSAPEDPALAVLDAELAAALGTQLADHTLGSRSASSSSSDSDMSDSQMEALDAQLGAIFAQRRDAAKSATPKQQRRVARDTVVNFKTKILELLEAYVRTVPRAPPVISIVQPVLEAMHLTSSRPIAQRMCDLVRMCVRLYKLRPLEGQTDEQIKNDEVGNGDQDKDAEPQRRQTAWALLHAAHDFVQVAHSQLQAKAASSASLLAVKVYLTHGGMLEPIAERYARTEEALKGGKEVKFRTCFIDDWRNWRVQAEKMGQLKGRL